ncbi:MAG TPA: PAS domain S-box protein, partial [Dongiaceae bacterium]
MADIIGLDRTSAGDELARRTAMLDAVGFAATRIIGASDWRPGIQELLERLGVATDVSRVSVFEVHDGPDGRLVESCRYDWAAPGYATLSDDPRYNNISIVEEDGRLDDWSMRRQAGEVIQATLSEVTGDNRRIFLEQETKAFVSVPILLRDRWWGFLGFDDCKRERRWTPLEIGILKTAAALIAGAIERTESDERLRLSEERYALAARGANDGLWDLDLATGRAYFSPRLHEILGLAEGALGHSITALLAQFHPQDVAAARRYFRLRFSLKRRKFRLEGRHRAAGEGERWFVARGMIVYRDDRPSRIIGSLRDITDVKMAEAKLRTLSDDAPVLLCMIDPQDRLVFANRGFLDFFGRTLEDMSNGRWDWKKDVHPDDVARTMELYEAAQARQESVAFEHRVRRYDGEYRWVQETEVARFTLEGEFAGYVGALVDITDRKRAEGALRLSEARVRAILNTATDAIITTDETGHVVGHNPAAARMFGLDEAAIMGRPVGDLIVPPHLRQAHRDGMRRYLETGKAHVLGQLLELEAQRADGTIMPVELTVTEVPLPEGRLFTAIIRDISERKRYQQQLADGDRQRTVLARHFSPNMVDELMRAGGQLDFERTQVIGVLFADIFNFTAMSAALPTREVIELLRRFHSLVEEAVFGHNGTLDKYIGDGVMATFGTPRPGPQDATNALNCTRSLVKGLNRWNRERAEQGLRLIRIGIGVHYGQATLGNVGSARRFEHTVVGETVNLASRIENLTRTLDTAILVSDAVMEAAKNEGGEAATAGFTEMGSHAIRGHREPVELWGLTALAL